MTTQDKIAKYQEIEKRGLLSRLPVEKQQAWAEIKTRGLHQNPEKYSGWEKAKYVTRAGLEGALLGLGDIAAGATNTLASPLGKTVAAITEGTPVNLNDFNPVQNFSQGRGDFVREQEDFAKEHPNLQLTGEIGGGLLTALFGGAGKAAQTAAKTAQGTNKISLWGKTLWSNAKEGAKWGGAYGAGSGFTQHANEFDPMGALFGGAEGAAGGAAAGALFGVGKAGAAGVKKAVKKSVNAYKNRTYNAVARAAGDKIHSSIDSQTPLLDVADENIMRLAEGAKLKEPKAQQIFREYGEKRQGGQRAVLENLIDDNFGKEGFSRHMDKLAEARQAESGPLYDLAVNGRDGKGVIIESLPLNRDEMDYIEKVYKTRGMKSKTRGLPYNHMRVLDYAKQLMDRDIARAEAEPGATMSANLNELKKNFLAKIEVKNPVYKDARQVFSDYKKMEEAMRKGRKFNTGSTSERAYDLQSMNNAEKLHYMYGAREKLLENFNSWKNGSGNLPKKVFDKNTLERLKMLPVKNYNRMRANVQAEALASENINRLLGGSQTAERQASMGQSALNPRRTFKRWLADNIDRAINPNAQQVALMLTDPQALAKARQQAMKRDINVARKLGKWNFNALRAAGPLIRAGETPVSINQDSWRHIKHSPDFKTYASIPYIREIHRFGEMKKNVPNYKPRNDFSSWDYYKKRVKTPEGEKEMLLTVGQKPEGRILYNINPDVQEFLEKNPQFSQILDRDTLGVQTGSPVRTVLPITNSIPSKRRIVNPFSLTDFARRLIQPHAAALGAVQAQHRHRKQQESK